MANQRKLKDKKIKIYTKVEGKDSGGFPVVEFESISGDQSLWAYYRQLSSSEFYASAQINVNEECLFVVNWRDDIHNYDENLYIEYNSLWYKITRVDNFEGYKRDLYLYAKFYGEEAPQN